MRRWSLLAVVVLVLSMLSPVLVATGLSGPPPTAAAADEPEPCTNSFDTDIEKDERCIAKQLLTTRGRLRDDTANCLTFRPALGSHRGRRGSTAADPGSYSSTVKTSQRPVIWRGRTTARAVPGRGCASRGLLRLAWSRKADYRGVRRVSNFRGGCGGPGRPAEP